MTDTIRWEILEDGTISVMTDGISGTNHKSADELLEGLADMIGGDIVVEQRKGHVHKHQGSSVMHEHKH